MNLIDYSFSDDGTEEDYLATRAHEKEQYEERNASRPKKRKN
jgi:hypothetical protein